MPRSVLDAIKLGLWDFEPETMDGGEYDPTNELPGSDSKLTILAQRIEKGLPLWHPSDRRDCEDLDIDVTRARTPGA